MTRARDLASGQNGVRAYAMSSGITTFASGSVVTNGQTNQSVTFPVGRFTDTPMVMTTMQNAPGGTGNLVPRGIGVSTTGFTAYLYNPGSVTQTFTGAAVAWVAVQMTPTSGAG